MIPTRRLYYDDPALCTFTSRVVEVDAARRAVYLEATAFYPDSGGQPSDRGTLGGIAVAELVDEEERIAHVFDTAPPWAPGETVRGEIDAARRLDHREQHSGQHLLSAVFHEMFDAATVSFHLGEEASTIDLAVAALESAQIREVERRVNELIREDRPLSVTYEDAAAAAGLRKESAREGTLRIVSIEGLDRSACGGTHVARTGAIGALLIRKLDKIRGNVRVEFLGGGRAIARARADYEALAAAARRFSSPLDEVPALVAALQERAAASEKTARKLAGELATMRGAELHAATAPGGDGLRRAAEAVPALDDEVRARAAGFTGGGKALYIAAAGAQILIACSADSGLNSGALLKELIAKHGGRGGGGATLAQGSLASAEAAAEALGTLA
jgi:alanyl-tRNA synthetase